MYIQIEINYAAVFTAVAANIAFGFLWYGPIFGKAWQKEAGISADKSSKKIMIQALVLMVVGAFFTAYVLTHSSAIWRPSLWGTGNDSPSWSYGFYAAFFTWIGFYLPQLFNLVAWEQRSWKLFLINGSYHFINLQIVAYIVSVWR